MTVLNIYYMMHNNNMPEGVTTAWSLGLFKAPPLPSTTAFSGLAP